MTALQSLLAFTAAASLLTLTPGLDTALVLRTLTAEGARSALRAAIGIGLGCLVWGLAIGLGLGALLAASHLAYDLLRWVGAGYLLVLGVRLLSAPRHTFAFEQTNASASGSTPNWLVRGFLTNILNPKIGVFYVSFLPQFVPAGANVAIWSILLTAIHAALGLAWFALLILASRPILGALQRPAMVSWLDRLTGGLFVAFGLKLALSAR